MMLPTRKSLIGCVPPMIGTSFRKLSCTHPTASSTAGAMSIFRLSGKPVASKTRAASTATIGMPIASAVASCGETVGSCRLSRDRVVALSPVLMRSSATAISTMPRPEANARPTCCFCSAESTSWPRSPVPSSEASTTIAKAIMITWLRPSRMVRRAIGNCTLNSCWRSVAPNDWPTSLMTTGTCRKP